MTGNGTKISSSPAPNSTPPNSEATSPSTTLAFVHTRRTVDERALSDSRAGAGSRGRRRFPSTKGRRGQSGTHSNQTGNIRLPTATPERARARGTRNSGTPIWSFPRAWDPRPIIWLFASRARSLEARAAPRHRALDRPFLAPYRARRKPHRGSSHGESEREEAGGGRQDGDGGGEEAGRLGGDVRRGVQRGGRAGRGAHEGVRGEGAGGVRRHAQADRGRAPARAADPALALPGLLRGARRGGPPPGHLQVPRRQGQRARPEQVRDRPAPRAPDQAPGVHHAVAGDRAGGGAALRRAAVDRAAGRRAAEPDLRARQGHGGDRQGGARDHGRRDQHELRGRQEGGGEAGGEQEGRREVAAAPTASAPSA